MTFILDIQNHKPARRVSTGRRKRVTGVFPSRRAGRVIVWESKVERDFLRLIEIDSTVQAILAQPVKVEFYWQHAWHHATPDFWVSRRGDESSFYEVKPSKFLKDEEAQDRCEAIKRAIEAKGFRYEVAIEHDIRRQPRFKNVLELLRYSRLKLTDYDRLELAEWLREGPFTFAEIEATAKDPVRTHGMLKVAVLDGLLVIDMDEPIGPKTILRAGWGY